MQTEIPNIQIALRIINGELPKFRAKELVSLCKNDDDKEMVLSVAKGHTNADVLTQIFNIKK